MAPRDSALKNVLETVVKLSDKKVYLILLACVIDNKLIICQLITQGNKIRSTFCPESLAMVSSTFLNAESRGAIHFCLISSKTAENAIKVTENAGNGH